MRLPTRSDLQSTFDMMMAEQYHGIPGVVRIVAGQPKTKIAIAAMTHGDEPSGLGAFRFLLENRHILHDVELILAVHNVEGGAAWFKATTREERRRAGVLGWNFNRLPLGFPEKIGPPVLERIRRLWADVYPGTEVGLDIHSTTLPITPGGLLLDIGGDMALLERVSDRLPAGARFRGITPIQAGEGSKTVSMGIVFGGKGCKQAAAFEVEAGNHESPEGIRIAVQTVVSMLLELGCLQDCGIVERQEPQDVYDVLGAVMVPGPGYKFVDAALLKSFIAVQAGQPLLSGPGGDIIASRFDSRLIFLPSVVEIAPGDEKDEVAFALSHPQTRQRVIRSPKWLTEL